MVKVFHCADIHLDSPFSLYSPREAEKRRTELRAAFTSALMYAREKKADIFIISGDLFDSEYVTRDTRELLVREFAKCGDMKIFISPGNHDPFVEGGLYSAAFPENVKIFTSEKLSSFYFSKNNVCIHGYAFTSARVMFAIVFSSQYANTKDFLVKNKITLLFYHT